jgi:CubicO group peptidase (beta-lactamase class C family)
MLLNAVIPFIVFTAWFCTRPAVIQTTSNVLGYAAHTKCTHEFILDTDYERLQREEMFVPPVSSALEVEVNEATQEVVARLRGSAALERLLLYTGWTLSLPKATAKAFGAAGCRRIFPDAKEPQEQSTSTLGLPLHPVARDEVLKESLNPKLQALVEQDVTAHIGSDADSLLPRPKPISRAIVILQGGKVVAEAYAPGITPTTRLLGWSMTKSLHALVIGAAVRDGKVSLDQKFELNSTLSQNPGPDASAGGARKVALRELVSMSDVLPDLDENYNIWGAVPSMLFSSFSHAKFGLESAKKGTPENENAGEETKRRWSVQSESVQEGNFAWYYSSAVSNLLARLFREVFSSHREYLEWPWRSLLSKIGADSFVLGTDPSGTFVASSFSYASARDWAKLGQLVLNRGRWGDTQLIDEEYIDFIGQPHPLSGGFYGGSFWLNPGRQVTPEGPLQREPHIRRAEEQSGWTRDVLPPDALWMSGFQGQYVAVFPSLDAVVVRLGFEPTLAPEWDKVNFFAGVVENLVLLNPRQTQIRRLLSQV